MNGNKLSHADEKKDLGVLIDNKLKFHRQTATAIKKANRILGLVKKVIYVLRQAETTVAIQNPPRPSSP